jgi:hypothetical protein
VASDQSFGELVAGLVAVGAVAVAGMGILARLLYRATRDIAHLWERVARLEHHTGLNGFKPRRNRGRHEDDEGAR